MRKRSVLYASLAVAVVSISVACDKGGGGGGTQPTQVASVQIIGPEGIVAGAVVQYGVTIRYIDGTTKTATAMQNLSWRSSNPSVLSVSNSGLVTANLSGSGEAVVTAELTSDGIQATQKVKVWGQAKAVVTGEFDVTEQENAGQISYAVALRLTESGGVAASITGLYITFDNGWGGECTWTPDKLVQTRVPANGTLSLGALTCDDGHEKAFNVQVSIGLTDDNNHVIGVVMRRDLSSALVDASILASGDYARSGYLSFISGNPCAASCRLSAGKSRSTTSFHLASSASSAARYSAVMRRN